MMRTGFQTAQLFHLAGIVAGNLTTRTSNAQTVQQLEEIAPDGSDEIAG